jgi:stage II sporulation protein D
MADCEEMMQSYIVSQPGLRRRPKLVRGNETRVNTTERVTGHIQHRADLQTMTPSERRRKRHVLPILLGLLVGTSCVANPPHLDPVPPSNPVVRVELTPGGPVVTLDLEEYVVGSILAEADIRGLDANAAQRVAQVQAILARTYALANRTRHAHEEFDLCSTTHCQVYRSPEALSVPASNLARSASRATSGLVISYDGLPINALFHADCGGGTSDATVPWGGPTPPYLKAVGDAFCLRDNPTRWQFTVDRTDLQGALNHDPRTRVGTHLDTVKTTEKDQAGRVVSVVISGEKSGPAVRGEVLRQLLNERFGSQSIKSTRFTLARRGDQFVFEGQGWGHGIGLCQRGAAARARAGHSVAQILRHYYSGASLTQYY